MPSTLLRNGLADDLHRQLLDLAESQNQCGAGSGTTIPATFMRVTVRP